MERARRGGGGRRLAGGVVAAAAAAASRTHFADGTGKALPGENARIGDALSLEVGF